jgi:hypothetical protein
VNFVLFVQLNEQNYIIKIVKLHHIQSFNSGPYIHYDDILCSFKIPCWKWGFETPSRSIQHLNDSRNVVCSHCHSSLEKCGLLFQELVTLSSCPTIAESVIELDAPFRSCLVSLSQMFHSEAGSMPTMNCHKDCSSCSSCIIAQRASCRDAIEFWVTRFVRSSS